jgi:pimeloyl-ACP methyl ester carboxylesterase
MSDSFFVEADEEQLECAWFLPPVPAHADETIVMLHEGLGSLSMWKSFPAQLASRTGRRVLAYSRHGYGKSSRHHAQRNPLGMHEHEALVVLPELLERLGISRPMLFGHSDGASIALIYAAASNAQLEALVILAPHILVEPMCVEAITAARHAYLSADLRGKLARYHDNPDAAFWSWNDLWLAPGFLGWTIESHLPRIACPILAIQGYQDEYGTMIHVDKIAHVHRKTTVVKLENCGHSPHRDRPGRVLDAVTAFLGESRGNAAREVALAVNLADDAVRDL